jgi:ribosome maturation factor RimP
MSKLPMIQKIERLIEPVAQGLGYELVRVLMVGAGSHRPTLQIMAERPDGTMGVEDCEVLSKAISALLDVENAVDGAYDLELSSPGIDRPLTRLKDFDAYKNYEIKVELDTPVGNQKKFKGMLKGLDGNNVMLETDDKIVHALPFRAIERAKIVLTDELVRAAMKKQEARKN